jgi:hypothetical protein
MPPASLGIGKASFRDDNPATSAALAFPRPGDFAIGSGALRRTEPPRERSAGEFPRPAKARRSGLLHGAPMESEFGALSPDNHELVAVHRVLASVRPETCRDLAKYLGVRFSASHGRSAK